MPAPNVQIGPTAIGDGLAIGVEVDRVWSPAGVAALVAQVAAYATTATVTSIRARTSNPNGFVLSIDGSKCFYSVLAADVAAQQAALLSIATTAANVL